MILNYMLSFLETIGGFSNQVWRILNSKINLDFIGLGNISLWAVIGGGGAVALLLYKLVRWLL